MRVGATIVSSRRTWVCLPPLDLIFFFPLPASFTTPLPEQRSGMAFLACCPFATPPLPLPLDPPSVLTHLFSFVVLLPLTLTLFFPLPTLLSLGRTVMSSRTSKTRRLTFFSFRTLPLIAGTDFISDPDSASFLSLFTIL